MHAIQYIHAQVAEMRSLVDAALGSLTDEQFNWLPPGRANPICITLLHMNSDEDIFIQTFLQGKARLWDSNGWGERLSMPKTPDIGQNWDALKAIPLTLASVLDYQREVSLATDAYLKTLTPAGLERMVNFEGKTMPAAQLLIMFIIHSASHAGEIAALKGVQGAQGLPF